MDKVFKVGIFGLTPREHAALGSMFKLAVSRSRQYTLVPPAERAKAEIVLVDVDDANAVKEWRGFNEQHRHIPIVKVTKKVPPADAADIYLRLPLIIKRVLETLDKVYIPGSIGDDIPVPPPPPSPTPRSGVRALVVDDALPVRKAMEHQLGSFGMQIDFAETGEEALEFTKKHVYDIIFLDLMLPGIDGYKVCKTIKSEKMSKNTPVVMLTGKGGRFDKLKGTMAGASVYLTKPVEPEKLKEVIKQFLPNTQAHA